MRYICVVILFIVFIPFSSCMEEINFSELTMGEKVGQLIIAKPKLIDERWTNLNLGGIFLVNRDFSPEDYKKQIDYYQNNSKIKLFVSTDMEGYWNPFSFYNSKNFGEIKNGKEAYNLGKEQGEIMRDLGFNLDFSPIVEIRNNVWPGRSFIGTSEEIKNKISNYIKGLHSEDIMATAKHYPGGSLVKNPHIFRYKVDATKEELEMFDEAIKSDVDFVMVGHPIIYGELNSKGRQATISPEIIFSLKKKFEGIIITDAVTMMGLRISYLFNFKKVYRDLILAGNDIILDTHYSSGYKSIEKRISYLIKEAKNNPELMNRIDESSRKVLEKKGYKILD